MEDNWCGEGFGLVLLHHFNQAVQIPHQVFAESQLMVAIRQRQLADAVIGNGFSGNLWARFSYTSLNDSAFFTPPAEDLFADLRELLRRRSRSCGVWFGNAVGRIR